MPLLDHFHPPVDGRRRWEAFHTFWTAGIARHLNRSVLPEPYYAEPQVHVGGRVEVDVATRQPSVPSSEPGGGNGVAVATSTYTAPVAEHVLETVFPDDVEIRIFASEGGPSLVGAIEIVSPGNKDRDEARRAFVSKCRAYLHAGVGLVIVDVVTNRQSNLHDLLMDDLGQPETVRYPDGIDLYTTSFQPTRWQVPGQESHHDQIQARLYRLGVGEALPVVPLHLRAGPTIRLDLEATYADVLGDIKL